jgi:type VI secretion system secreted protein Hcp
MAETFKVVLKFDGSECAGYSSIVESGGVSREGSIEGLSFVFEAATARERGSGIGSGRREFKPVLFTKRVDEASPLIAKALTMNQVVEATFDFFRNDPNSGVTSREAASPRSR